MNEPHLLTPREVHDRLQSGADGLILVDVRTEREWLNDGRIAGAVLIPMDEIPSRAALELPPQAEIILYCHSGVRSNVAAWYMAQLGYANISDMRGGIEAWERAGLPVIRGT